MRKHKLVWNPDDPLALCEGETAKANQALHDYAFLGPGRSLAVLYQNYTKTTPDRQESHAPRTTTLRVLKAWSAEDSWQDRVARYDAQVQQREQSAYEARWAERRAAEREETWQVAQALRAKVLKMLEFPLTTVEQVTARRAGPNGVQHVDMTVIKPSRWAMRDVGLLAETAAKLARLSADMPTERVAVEDLTPRDLETMSMDQLLLLKQQLEQRKKGR